MNAVGTVLALRESPREGLCSYPNGIRVDQRIARVIAIALEPGAFRVWCAMTPAPSLPPGLALDDGELAKDERCTDADESTFCSNTDQEWSTCRR